jgi:hypothetical protein
MTANQSWPCTFMNKIRRPWTKKRTKGWANSLQKTMTTHELGFSFAIATLQYTWKQTWTKFNIEQKKNMERKTLGMRKLTWKKWWQQWWKWIGWQVGLYSHTTIIKYEVPQHENRAWWTPQTSIEDELDPQKKKKKTTKRSWWTSSLEKNDYDNKLHCVATIA